MSQPKYCTSDRSGRVGSSGQSEQKSNRDFVDRLRVKGKRVRTGGRGGSGGSRTILDVLEVKGQQVNRLGCQVRTARSGETWEGFISV